MLPLPAVLAFVLLLLLLYVPGFVVARALDDDPASDWLERVYVRVLVGALLNGWLAFTLAELGVFSLWLHGLLLVLLCGVAWVRGQGSGVRGCHVAGAWPVPAAGCATI